MGGRERVVQVLSIVRQVWDGDQVALRAVMLRGLGRYVATHEVSTQTIVRALRTYKDNPFGLVERSFKLAWNKRVAQVEALNRVLEAIVG